VLKQALHGYGRIDNEIVPYGFPGHMGNITYTYNLTLAKQLLEKAGLYGKKLSVEIMYEGTYSSEAAFANIIKGSLAQLGITVVLKPAPWDEMASTGPEVWKHPERAPHMIINDWWPTIPSPYDYLYNLLHSDSEEWNWAGYNNTEFDHLIDAAWSLEGSNYSAAMRLYHDAEMLVYRQAPAINLWDEVQPYLYNPKHVELSEEAFNPLYIYVLFVAHLQVKG
jgi:peptide/nickel transport system substrate-binding protein